MKKFKFFTGIVPNTRNINNGVTDSYLIEISRDIYTYSDWIYSTFLIIDEATGLDSIIIEFKDIDNSFYWCKILSDRSYKIFLEILESEDEDVILEPVFISPERGLNATHFINYLKNMPKTIISSL
jgi:hypothetical protein